MRHLDRPVLAIAAVAAALCGVAAIPAAGTAPKRSAEGSWQRLPAAPISPDFAWRTSVWTGARMLVFGRDQVTAKDARGNPYAVRTDNVAASYDPAARVWRRLSPPRGDGSAAGSDTAVWTGKELLVWSPLASYAYTPARDTWRRLSRSLPGGIVVWTGREAIGWGGGCCGDVSANGVAYDPATGRYRALARSPLAGSQHPVGAWTGRELVLVVAARDAARGHAARAAAYDPARKAWRRISAPPVDVAGAAAVWTGSELVVAGGTASPRAAVAYDPSANRWRRLPAMPGPRVGAVALRAGARVVVWGGKLRPGGADTARAPLVYASAAGRWETLTSAPLAPRLESTAVWTGRSLLVFGGIRRGGRHWGHDVPAGAALLLGAR